MELNYDCFRDVLLVLEASLEIKVGDGLFSDPTSLSFPKVSLDVLAKSERLNIYERKELFYALYNLKQAGYVDGLIKIKDGVVLHCVVTDITFKGHMFLKDVRNDSIWNKAKSMISSVGSASLPIVTEVALNLVRGSLGL